MYGEEEGIKGYCSDFWLSKRLDGRVVDWEEARFGENFVEELVVVDWEIGIRV